MRKFNEDGSFKTSWWRKASFHEFCHHETLSEGDRKNEFDELFNNGPAVDAFRVHLRNNPHPKDKTVV